MDKRGLEISFAWLFSLIVGAFILFLAIYGVVKLMGVQEGSIDAESAKQIEVILNSLETNFETSTKTILTMPAEARIYNKCDPYGDFGQQGIRVSQKSFGDWTRTNYEPTFYNRYLFSNEYEEGKTFYLFFKPFEFPFKVSDLIYLSSANVKYCFAGMNSQKLKDSERELKNLGQTNLLLNSEEECINRDDVFTVCFDNSNCDIEVDYNEDTSTGSVTKNYNENRDTVYFYGDALMYAAIFSEKNIYECQLQRLMKRTSKLAEIYQEKSALIARTGCTSTQAGYLNGLKNIEIKDSSELKSYISLVESIKSGGGGCELW